MKEWDTFSKHCLVTLVPFINHVSYMRRRHTIVNSYDVTDPISDRGCEVFRF